MPLIQVIEGNDIRMIGKEERHEPSGLQYGTGYYERVYFAMTHPELSDGQIIMELALRNS